MIKVSRKSQHIDICPRNDDNSIRKLHLNPTTYSLLISKFSFYFADCFFFSLPQFDAVRDFNDKIMAQRIKKLVILFLLK